MKAGFHATRDISGRSITLVAPRPLRNHCDVPDADTVASGDGQNPVEPVSP